MLRRRGVKDDRAATIERAPRARGGVSPGGILTGVVVSFGAIFLLSALIGGVLAASGVVDDNITGSDVVDAGIAGGIAFVIAQFLAYLWGGYTAGRMARGAGLINGLLVPLLAIIMALLVGGIAAGLGATADMNLPFQNARLPLEQDIAIEWGVGIGIAAVVAMFLGGGLGGGLGARWHTKLERRAADEVEGRHLSQRPAPVAPPQSDADRTTTTDERATTDRDNRATTDRTVDDTTARQPRR
ncbi:MAG: TIGR04086 family membrane protein [Actinomycetota bacterium]